MVPYHKDPALSSGAASHPSRWVLKFVVFTLLGIIRSAGLAECLSARCFLQVLYNCWDATIFRRLGVKPGQTLFEDKQMLYSSGI